MEQKMLKWLSLSLILALCVSAGCRKAPINGDLDGQWQVMTIDFADGTSSQPDRVYYAIYLHTVQLHAVSGSGATGNMTYDRDASTLYFDFPYAAPGTLKRYGISGSSVKFDILKLTSKILVLQSDEAMITFRKF